MILADECYTVVRDALLNNGITAYSDQVPTETQYKPFVMYEIASLKEFDDHPWAFNKDYEKLTIRFNIFCNANNANESISMACAVRPETTSTGNGTATISATRQNIGIMIALQPSGNEYSSSSSSSRDSSSSSP